MRLERLLIRAAERFPDATAVRAAEGQVSYLELDQLANKVAHYLNTRGISAGDRIGIYLEKSISVLAIMQGALRIGAVYVPIEPEMPPVRAVAIIQDCDMKIVATDISRGEILQTHNIKADLFLLNVSSLDYIRHDVKQYPDTPFLRNQLSMDSMAYILYTSGSTGTPKGVCISHANAQAFITWAAKELQANNQDRFSSHAQFNFDLSVLDIYVAFYAGAQICLIPSFLSFAAQQLKNFIVRERITIWYSVPAVLILMQKYGGLNTVQNLPLRTVIFAGESYPIKHLRALRKVLPKARLLNLYGPTETNVCTFFEVDDKSLALEQPLPIGKACSGNKVWAKKADDTKAKAGEEGILMVLGPSVMMGYWGKPPQAGEPYNTGDLVKQGTDGNYHYIGRLDHMVKVRGYRIDLGEIEHVLFNAPEIDEVAVIAQGQGMYTQLVAFYVPFQNAQLDILDLKKRCADRLPRYMVVDRAVQLAALPRTLNGKVDRKKLVKHC